MSLSRSSVVYTTNLGTPLANTSVGILDRYRGFTPVQVFSDPYGASPIANPTTDGTGLLTFYAPPGVYSLGVGVYRFNLTLTFQDATLNRVKTSSTARSNTATVAVDPDLVVPVAANTRYNLEALLFPSGDTTADFRMTFVVPAGATIVWVPRGPSPLISVDPATLTMSQQVSGSEAVLGVYSSAAGAIAPKGHIQTGATAGNVELRWAQGTSAGAPTTLAAGSWLSLSKVRDF